MFTGIIESVGEIRDLVTQGGDQRLTIATGKLDMTDVALGDSIACNGVCLTVVEFGNDYFIADVSGETIELTGFKHYRKGQPVNLEKALTPTKRLGGHLVSGHVDGIGEVTQRWQDARSVKGSAHSSSRTLSDGLSLTSVPRPVIIASCRARNRCTSCRAAGPVIH